MIPYLIYSTVCMGLVLLFYHAVLAREKIYQINRWYLLGALLFSLTVPLMPFGIFDSLLTLSSNTEISQILSGEIENTNAESVYQVSDNPTEKDSVSHTSYFEWITPFLLWVYGIVTLILSFRMIRHLYRMQLKSMKNPATSFKDHKVVLVAKEVVPHTFWKTIFVNKKQYENKEISEEVMIHELIHAEQNHSLDIIIVEILKTICWFNPVLYFYKKAIQVNHEYIADDKVLSNGADIADYQTLLLKMRTAKSAHYLSTSLNFNITKKRFQMMTLNHSTARSSLKLALIIPFFVLLGITFGCEPASMESDNQVEDIVSLEIVDAETIKLNGETVSASQFESVFADLAMDPEQTIIDFKVHKNATMGLVTDVQKVLREKGTLKINYSTVQSNDGQSKRTWRSKSGS
ncbi:Signal transducer regulating beta-lactamase production, contains metallopeptidase domain [Fodinibius roseus]|uniref:Signal transducer regulating beta-lactamase production, contains metallopeptidase domain n=1 Tax=Fodinibius roseus TaxID=1194090 RepID=A0A1M5FGF7_9BACT|nr:M56 family metallopeptidase [Fodinibius roseus]SHF90630.1 Signal transducer regulating beta-lactamase production, contains metallopeptidase domain [Fodinibius roseus]